MPENNEIMENIDQDPLAQALGADEVSDNDAEQTSVHEVILKDRYQVHADQAAPDFDHAYASGYVATHKGKTDRQYVAVIPKDRYPVRQSILYPYYNLQPESLIELVDWGVVKWLADGTTRFCLIFAKPEGDVLLPKHQKRREALTEEQVKKSVIAPIAYALRDLSDRGIFHGNIRPDNIFYSKDNTAILGDCFSSLTGAVQPTLYETVERGMCDVQSRGVGVVTDDIYSLGATVVTLLRGENPFLGMSSEEITEAKINKGSFSALTEGMRFTSSMSEFLRATLYDDSKNRWSIEQLVNWVEGTRSHTNQKTHSKKASRAVEFNGKKYFRIPLLARDLSKNISEAVRVIEDGSIINWLERSLKAQEISDSVTEAISRASMGGKGGGDYAARLVTYVSMALDPTAPIRYKGVSVLPNGIVGGLIEAILTGKDIKVYVELIKHRYPWTWLGFKENMANDTLDLLRIFDSCSKIINRTGANNGIERCLYELSADTPCLSPLFKKKYVVDPKDLIKAMNELVGGMDSSTTLIDRHVASFITCRDNKDQSGLIGLIQGTDKMRRSLAIITLFQNIQVRYYKKPLVNLTKRLASDAERVIERYHNTDLANDIRKKIAKTVEKGDITKLLGLVDNPQVVNQDKLEFEQARQEYFILKQEHENISKRLDGNKTHGAAVGRELAAVISGVLAGVLIATLLLVTITTGFGG